MVEKAGSCCTLHGLICVLKYEIPRKCIARSSPCFLHVPQLAICSFISRGYRDWFSQAKKAIFFFGLISNSFKINTKGCLEVWASKSQPYEANLLCLLSPSSQLGKETEDVGGRERLGQLSMVLVLPSLPAELVLASCALIEAMARALT